MAPKLITNIDLILKEEGVSLYYVNAKASSLRIEDVDPESFVCGFALVPLTLPPQLALAAVDASFEMAIDGLSRLLGDVGSDPGVQKVFLGNAPAFSSWGADLDACRRKSAARIAKSIAQLARDSDDAFNLILNELSASLCDMIALCGESELTSMHVSDVLSFAEGFLNRNLEHWGEYMRKESPGRILELRQYSEQDPPPANDPPSSN